MRYIFFLEKGQSKKIPRYRKYFTSETRPEIMKISFYIDNSRCNLQEVILYSDNSESTEYYHLVSKLLRLDKPNNMALFDLSK